jgi:hypothetical protein
MNNEEKANILRALHHNTMQNTEHGNKALFFNKE